MPVNYFSRIMALFIPIVPLGSNGFRFERKIIFLLFHVNNLPPESILIIRI